MMDDLEDVRYSENLDAFAPALVDMQAELPTLEKTSESHHGKYANLTGTIEAIKAILHSHGFAALQPTSGGTGGHVSVTTMLMHKSGQWMRATLTMPTGGNGAQGVGSAISYGRRYSLVAMLCLGADDDDGHAASQQPAQPRKPAQASAAPRKPGAPTQAVTKRAMALFNEAGIKDRAQRIEVTAVVCKRPIESWNDVEAVEAHEVMDVLDRLIKGKVTLDYAAGHLSIKAVA